MTTTCPFRPNQIAYVNLFLCISSILDNLNSWRIENTESSRRVYSNMRSTREILSGHSAPYFHDDRLHCHNDRLRYCELPNVWHINIDFTAMKTVVRKRNIGHIFTGRDEIKKGTATVNVTVPFPYILIRCISLST